MKTEIFNTQEYKEVINRYLIDTISIFFNKNEAFSIVCDVQYLEFNPPLPEELSAQFGTHVLFNIAEYSFESAKVEDNYFIFEAGFGSQNFGSVVSMPILAIKQLIVDEIPLITNIATPTKIATKEEKVGNSMNIFLNNPENQKILKNRKKR
ncbi:hypothetical protein MNB_SV-15-628 [hydrothermal vent metagenome]|uniref:Stringent starvation protein B n=1 Tax=hydrothermal vent metagenome TaxID=652676 RepID=A0A1W1EK09_9ZZZZ